MTIRCSQHRTGSDLRNSSIRLDPYGDRTAAVAGDRPSMTLRTSMSDIFNVHAPSAECHAAGNVIGRHSAKTTILSSRSSSSWPVSMDVMLSPHHGAAASDVSSDRSVTIAGMGLYLKTLLCVESSCNVWDRLAAWPYDVSSGVVMRGTQKFHGKSALITGRENSIRLRAQGGSRRKGASVFTMAS